MYEQSIRVKFNYTSYQINAYGQLIAGHCIAAGDVPVLMHDQRIQYLPFTGFANREQRRNEQYCKILNILDYYNGESLHPLIITPGHYCVGVFTGGKVQLVLRAGVPITRPLPRIEKEE